VSHCPGSLKPSARMSPCCSTEVRRGVSRSWLSPERRRELDARLSKLGPTRWIRCQAMLDTLKPELQFSMNLMGREPINDISPSSSPEAARRTREIERRDERGVNSTQLIKQEFPLLGRADAAPRDTQRGYLSCHLPRPAPGARSRPSVIARGSHPLRIGSQIHSKPSLRP
jgi:hypothetical protein